MSDSPQNTPRSGFTVDLSSGSGPAKPARPKGFVPVVQQTINLTTKKAAPQEAPRAAAPEATSASAGNAPRRSGSPTAAPGNRRSETPRSKDAPRGDTRGGPSGGTSLADLLDEATLARLRGGA